MEPGVVMPLHRHSGEIHAYNLMGTRKLCTGELIGPGDYVYEPPGNTDWWKIVGDEPMLALVIVMGTVEFLGPGGVVTARATSSTQLADYQRHCREHGWVVQDLLDH
jgi:2,4'-dihydroxyacetophenone dioxygenase